MNPCFGRDDAGGTPQRVRPSASGSVLALFWAFPLAHLLAPVGARRDLRGPWMGCVRIERIERIVRFFIGILLAGGLGLCAPAFAAGAAAAAPAAPAAPAAVPVLPALQSLITGAPATASGASAADAASAPSPASQAEFTRSLDSVISTLDSDKQRNALLSQLKKLRSASENVAPAPASGAAANASGLLGAIASGLASVEADARRGPSPLHYWAGRFNAAGIELYTIASGGEGETLGRILFDMAAMLLGWGVCAATLRWLERRMLRRFSVRVGLRPNPSTIDLLVFVLHRVAPWIVAFIGALIVERALPQALGRTIGVVIAYAIVAGAVFSSICLIMFSLFGAGHRRVAVNVLIHEARRLLWAIGVLAALGDAATNYEVASELGVNLAALVSTCANMTAAVLTAVFAIGFRRPVAHLIRNRSYQLRQDHKALTEVFDVLASLWQLPMLLLAAASIVATLGGISSHENVLQISVVTALLLVLAFFLSAVVFRITRPDLTRVRRRSPYLRRLLRFAGTLLVLFVWLAYFESCARLWDVSLAAIIEANVAARGIAHAIFAILFTVFLAWLVWIVLDTAILEALNPSGPRTKGRAPSTRARTMLPLVRNALLVTILTIAGIVTAANLGINVTPLLAGAGVIGLAIGFGAQSLVTDLITGLFIIIEETISVGDWIDLDNGHAGTVEHLSIRTVRLRDGQGAIHAIPFSQIKIVKNLSRDFAFAVFEVRVPFSVDLDTVTRMIRETGAELVADFRYRREILGPVEVWGLDRFDPNWMVVKGQIKTRPLQQWSVARAFNARLKRHMDEAGIEMPVPQMQVHMSPRGEDARDAGDPDDGPETAAEHDEHGAPQMPDEAHARAEAESKQAAAASDIATRGVTRDASHEPRPAPPPTGSPEGAPPQIPTAGRN
ncbi:mechanosensitive ion channel domain-containing protein [Paraburkholderia tropica]|uniref:mechanosensitive ion channel domain-containing protein n=1 Tax=Paraburkholderia tropica TaxID=92647 RepID=UPI0038B7F43B